MARPERKGLPGCYNSDDEILKMRRDVLFLHQRRARKDTPALSTRFNGKFHRQIAKVQVLRGYLYKCSMIEKFGMQSLYFRNTVEEERRSWGKLDGNSERIKIIWPPELTQSLFTSLHKHLEPDYFLQPTS